MTQYAQLTVRMRFEILKCTSQLAKGSLLRAQHVVLLIAALSNATKYQVILKSLKQGLLQVSDEDCVPAGLQLTVEQQLALAEVDQIENLAQLKVIFLPQLPSHNGNQA